MSTTTPHSHGEESKDLSRQPSVTLADVAGGVPPLKCRGIGRAGVKKAGSLFLYRYMKYLLVN